jgi:hypothetical protein
MLGEFHGPFVAHVIEGNHHTLPAPPEELGLTKPNPLAERVARLYKTGALVSIDKLSRIPPLDAPISLTIARWSDSPPSYVTRVDESL